MAKLSKEKTQQIILIVLITCAALCGVWFLLIKSQLNTMAAMRAEKEKAISNVLNAKRLAQQADSIQNGLIRTQQQLDDIESKMASGDFFMWSFKLVESAMATNNLKIIDTERPREDEVGLFARFPYRSIRFTVRASGYFHDFGTFTRDFENQHPYMRCCNLSLMAEGPPSGESEREKLAIRFEIVALVKPNQS